MNLLKYNDYITEKMAYELLLESKVIFSKKFTNLFTKMKSNKVASDLLNIYTKDVNVAHNYIDVTDEKDAVSFTPDRKVQELLKDKPQLWEVISSERYLTHSSGNNSLFEALGYEKPEGEPWAPSTGTVGEILGETVSRKSGNIYVIFQEEGTTRKTVLNKEALERTDASSDSKVWSTSRNNIKIGRLVRAILKASGLEFTDKDIEELNVTYDKVVVVANLPYYITTPIIMKIIEESSKVKEMVLMMQLEVARRFTSKPSTKDYNSLSIAIQYKTNANIAMKVPRSVFIPAPNVDSAIVKLVVKDELEVSPANEKLFYKIVRASFSQRRKTLANNLFSSLSIPKAYTINMLEELNYNTLARAESLSVTDFIQISDYMNENKAH